MQQRLNEEDKALQSQDQQSENLCSVYLGSTASCSCLLLLVVWEGTLGMYVCIEK